MSVLMVSCDSNKSKVSDVQEKSSEDMSMEYALEDEVETIVSANPKKTVILDTDEELEELAKMIVDNLQTEAMVKVHVGYGGRAELLQDLTRSYQEAKMALEAGRIFYVEQSTFSYSRLGIGRLIYQLPISLCEMFLKEVFGEAVPDKLDEETTITINKFFENNLNVS